MVNKNDLIQEAEKEGFEFSPQALNMLLNIGDNALVNAQKLINLAKNRKVCIAGGDVNKFILRNELPTSMITSDDFEDELDVKVKKIVKEFLQELAKKVGE